MRRSEIPERELDRLADLAHCEGLTLRCLTDIDGNLTFSVSGLGSFPDAESLETAIRDSAAAVLSATLKTFGHACCPAT